MINIYKTFLKFFSYLSKNVFKMLRASRDDNDSITELICRPDPIETRHLQIKIYIIFV